MLTLCLRVLQPTSLIVKGTSIASESTFDLKSPMRAWTGTIQSKRGMHQTSTMWMAQSREQKNRKKYYCMQCLLYRVLRWHLFGRNEFEIKATTSKSKSQFMNIFKRGDNSGNAKKDTETESIMSGGYSDSTTMNPLKQRIVSAANVSGGMGAGQTGKNAANQLW